MVLAENTADFSLNTFVEWFKTNTMILNTNCWALYITVFTHYGGGVEKLIK